MSTVSSKSDKVWIPVIVLLSSIIPLAVLALMLMPSEWRIEIGIGPRVLPLFHAVLNGTTALLLLLGVNFIRNKQVKRHKAVMVTAFVLSAVFLVSYVISKLSNDPVPFGGEGAIKYIYFFILISHILLSVTVLPLALMSIYRAFTDQISSHKKLVKWTFPIWLYVAVTGVMVYFFMAPYYV